MRELTQIPIYRAKRKNGNEYVQGNLQQDERGYYYISKYLPPVGYGSTKIDPSTLAIHFPDMLDKDGKRIFASLSEDGVGGDIIAVLDTSERDNKLKTIALHNGFHLLMKFTNRFNTTRRDSNPMYNIYGEITGIYEGGE